MKIYICSHNPEKAKAHAEGREITYDWWSHYLPKRLEDAEYRACAKREMEGIQEANEIHVLTEEGLKVPGGMWFEAGFAFAIGKRVVLFGPIVNIFCHLLRTEDEVAGPSQGRAGMQDQAELRPNDQLSEKPCVV